MLAFRLHCFKLLFIILTTFLQMTATEAGVTANDQLGLRAPDGFEISLYADENLANDIYSLTVDSLGRVVVSGRGYVRILLDTDHDGIADTAKQFVDGPDSGAQGLLFLGRDLICTGDQGLLRYADNDADDRADGPPRVLLEANAGGEHDLHAVRQGPDGYLYLMCGNMAGITGEIASQYTSPVKDPEAGTLLRMSARTPNRRNSRRRSRFRRTEILAHGFRNAYDFDFNPLGDIFTYDSDGEREVSLPWYRPTRVFQVLPGSHAGWLSRHWKRPHYFFDMPPVIGSFGRGSPTGVVCYRHNQFPKQYQGALFVLDWTYGRMITLPLAPEGSIYKSEPEDFITAVGQHGFAPTDAAVGPDGSLYVSVGGRGTRGSVYRIRWKDAKPSPEPSDNLTRCLSAPQPLSSWSRSHWEPLAQELGAEPFQQAARDETLPVDQRIRAVEILTEKFSSIDSYLAADIIDEDRNEDDLDQQTKLEKAQLRARLAWSLGRRRSRDRSPTLLKKLLQDEHPLVVRQALENLVGKPSMFYSPYITSLAKLFTHSDPYVQQTLARVMAADEDMHFAPQKTAIRTNMMSVAFRNTDVSSRRAFYVLRHLQKELPPALKLDGIRTAQIALGDVGPAQDATNNNLAPVFQGYASRNASEDSKKVPPALVESIAASFPTEDKTLNHELGRLIAMLAPDNPTIFNKILDQITADSHPVDDIHYLIILARLPAQRTAEQRNKIADAVISLETKIESASLNRDSNWDDRISEMFAAHIELDPELPDAMIAVKELGAPGHTPLVQSFTGKKLEQAIDHFVARIKNEAEYQLTPDVARLLGRSQRPEVINLLRQHADEFSIRSTILSILAAHPDPQDRPLFVAGLDIDDVGILSEITTALQSFPPASDPPEIVALVRTLRRLTATSEQRTLQDTLVRLLRSATDQSFSYEFDQPHSNPQSAAINAWTAWAEETYPDQWSDQVTPPALTDEQLENLLSKVNWEVGNAERGKTIFDKRSCAQCHNGRSSLGPDLAGVTARFSRRDLFKAIFNPHRDVSPRYQTTLILTDDGRTHTGRIIYGSVDGLVFRTSTNQTLRINSNEILEERPLTTSLMPVGLLNDLPPEDLAHLYAHLQTLNKN